MAVMLMREFLAQTLVVAWTLQFIIRNEMDNGGMTPKNFIFLYDL